MHGRSEALAIAALAAMRRCDLSTTSHRIPI
jgi:hypothetical protein